MKTRRLKHMPLWSILLLTQGLLNVLPMNTQTAQAAEQEVLTPLSLAEALDLAQQSYALKSQRLQVDMQSAQVLQTRQWANPSLTLGAENTPSIKGGGAELNLKWQQSFNPAQQAQIEVAQQQASVSQITLQKQSQALQRDVTQAFYTVLMWQAYLEKNQKLQENALHMQQIIEAQYAQGKVLLAERNRAQIAQEQLQIQQQNTQIQFQEAQALLAGLVNRPPPFILQGELMRDLSGEQMGTPPTEHQEKSEVILHPELQERQAHIAQAKKNLALQKALVWENSTLSLGINIIPDENNLGALTQLTLPMPVLHQNQGGIRSSEQALTQAQLQYENTNFLLRTRWQQVLRSYQLTQKTLSNYQQQLLPLAQKNLTLIQHTYQQGKQSYLEVLDAQRSHIGLQQAYILQWGQYHRFRAELIYLSTSGFKKTNDK